MGEAADLMIDGVLCQQCGALITDDDWDGAVEMSDGYPRYCFECGGDPGTNGATKRKAKHGR